MNDEKIQWLEEFSAASREIMGNLEKLPLDRRLTLIAQHAARICGAEASGTLLIRREGYLRFEAGFGYVEQETLREQEFAICNGPGSGLTSYIAHEGKLFNAHGEELTRHFAVRGEKPKHLPSGACHSLLAIPLKKKDAHGEKLVGLIRVDNKKADGGGAAPGIRFTKEDELFLSIFAEVVVAALENADVVRQMREQKDRLAGLVDCSPNGIIALDRDGNVKLFNEQAERIMGYKAQEVMDKPLTWLQTPHGPCDPAGLIPSSDGARRCVQLESLVNNKSGEPLMLRYSSSLLYDADGMCSGSVGYFEDLRLRKKAERRHKLLHEATRLVAQAKSLREGMQCFLELMASILPHTFCRILLLDETQQAFEVGAACRFRECSLVEAGLHRPVALKEWPGLRELIWGNNLAVLRLSVPEYAPTLRRLSELLELESVIQTLLLVPLKIENKVVGLLEFGEIMSEEERPFSTEDIDFCVSIAARVSILIDRMNMYDQTKRSEQRHKMLHEALLHLRSWRGKHELQHELVRIAVKLFGCNAGGLFINHAEPRELELVAAHGLPGDYLDRRISHSDGVIGQAARSGKPEHEHNYAARADADPLIKALKLKELIAAPLRNEAGEVEAVLFVADAKRRFVKTDLEVLGSLAEHASLEMQTSRLLTQEQRTLSKLNTLHKFSNFVQTEEDLDRIMHAVLTGVTADYGLRFNRAVLLFLDKHEQGMTLVGQMGIGNLDEQSAVRDWEQDEKEGRKDLGSYLALLDELDELPSTPVDKVVKGLRLVVRPDDEEDVFSQIIRERRPLRLMPNKLAHFPAEFVSAFGPAAPCVVIPLEARNEMIGVLVADNKFNRVPVSDEDLKMLHTFANGTATAIHNGRLLKLTRAELGRLRALYEMSGASDLKQVLRIIVTKAREMFQAESCSVWSYDHMRNKLLTDELEVDGLTDADVQIFKDLEPANQGTIYAILEGGWVGVSDTAFPPPGLLGAQMQQHLLETGVRSFQGIALRVGDEEVGAGDRAAGVLYLNYKEPRVFSDEERRALKNFATYAALSLRNARLLDQVTRTNNAAEVVARVSALEENPNSTLLTVVEGTRKAVDCDAVVLYAFDEATNKLTPPVYAGPDSSAAEWLNIKAPETDLVYKIFQMDEPYIAEKNAEDPLGLLRTGFAQREEIVSCMALPLRAAGRSIGVMFVNYRTRNRFASDDLNNIRLFADQAAVAIRNFQLFKELKKKLSDQKALAKLSEALLGISTLQETLDRAVKVAAEVLDVVHCNIVLRADNGTLMLSAACGWEQEMVGQYKLADDTGSQTGYTIMTRGPVISEDIDHEKRFAILSVVRDHGVKSSMSVPMSMIDGEIIGAMLVHTKEHHRFTEAEVNLLSLVANQTAIAAQRARLYEDLRQTKGLVGARTALAWMGMASSIWGHSVNNHAVTIKDQVKLLMEMLRQEAPAPLSDELLADVGRRAARIRKVADAIRSKVITPPLSAAKVESVQIDVLVRERLKQLRDKESYKPFELTATGSPGVFVHVNEFWFNQALDQLIDNAIQAMAESSHKSLNVDMRVKNGAVEIAVTDTGTGFKPDVLAMLFNKQVEKDSGSKGLGMGLLMVQCIVEAYSGEINVAATGPTGTTMVIRLPYERGGEVTQGATDRFLLVGDSTDAHWRDVLEETLAPLGQLDSVGEQAAADLMAERKYRAVFVNASAVDNFALLTARLRTRRPDTRIVVVTASPRWEFAREAFRSGATDYLRKTVDRKELSLSLTQALAKPLLPWPHHQKSFTGEECHAKTNTSC